MSKRHTEPFKPSKSKQLLVYLVLFLVTLGFVLRPLAKGAMFYQTYWGGAVFVPFVVVIAGVFVVVMLVALFKRK